MNQMRILGWILLIAVLAFIVYRKRQSYTAKAEEPKKVEEAPKEKSKKEKKEEEEEPVKNEIEE
jgi:flagellar biosynthesis component FlhA